MKYMTLPLLTAFICVSVSGCALSTSENAEQAAATKETPAPQSKPDPLSPQVLARDSIASTDSSLPVMTVYKIVADFRGMAGTQTGRYAQFELNRVQILSFNHRYLEAGFLHVFNPQFAATTGRAFVNRHYRQRTIC